MLGGVPGEIRGGRGSDQEVPGPSRGDHGRHQEDGGADGVVPLVAEIPRDGFVGLDLPGYDQFFADQIVRDVDFNVVVVGGDCVTRLNWLRRVLNCCARVGFRGIDGCAAR